MIFQLALPLRYIFSKLFPIYTLFALDTFLCSYHQFKPLTLKSTCFKHQYLLESPYYFVGFRQSLLSLLCLLIIQDRFVYICAIVTHPLVGYVFDLRVMVDNVFIFIIIFKCKLTLYFTRNFFIRIICCLGCCNKLSALISESARS